MSEADGLQRLTEYLNQTRKQAEVAVDCLNIRIKELEQEREKYLGERDYYKNYAEQLRLENSKKWRLQERDDWKALVDSVQKDRSRLQDDCHKLEEELNMAYDELNRIEEERDCMKIALQESSKGVQKEKQDDCTGDVEGHQHGQHIQDHSDDLPNGHHEDMLEYETEHECTTPVPDDHSSSKEHNTLHEHQADSLCSSHPCSPNDKGTFPNLSIDLPRSSENEKMPPDPTGISRTSSTTSSRAGSPRAGQKVSSTKTTPRCSATSPTSSRRLSINGNDRDQEPTTPSQSPTPNDGSPRAIVRELRKELSKARAEIDILRKTSATESLAQEQEISRLREEVHMLRQREQDGGLSSSGGSTVVSGENGGVGNGQRHTDYSHGESSYPPAIPQPPSVRTTSPSSISIWSPLSVLGYLFSYSSGASTLASSHSEEPPRTSAQYV